MESEQLKELRAFIYIAEKYFSYEQLAELLCFVVSYIKEKDSGRA